MSAIFSDCGLFRYELERDVQMDGIVVALFGVNPSTAGVVNNDSTIRKDIGFAKVHGWRRIIKGNVFAFRSTDVRGLASAADPIGPLNRWHVDQIIDKADLLVPCWGSRDKLPKALRPHLDRMERQLKCSGKPVRIFGLTKSGDPIHPLMLSYSTPLVPWGYDRTTEPTETRLRPCGHVLGTTRWCPDCELAESRATTPHQKGHP